MTPICHGETVACHADTKPNPTNLILQCPAEIHVELFHAASVQVVDRQDLISFVEEALGLWLAGPAADPATQKQGHSQL